MEFQEAIRTLRMELGIPSEELAESLDMPPERLLGERGGSDPTDRAGEDPPEGWRKSLGLTLRERARDLLGEDPLPEEGEEGELPTYRDSRDLTDAQRRAERLVSLARQIEWGGPFPLEGGRSGHTEG